MLRCTRVGNLMITLSTWWKQSSRHSCLRGLTFGCHMQNVRRAWAILGYFAALPVGCLHVMSCCKHIHKSWDVQFWIWVMYGPFLMCVCSSVCCCQFVWLWVRVQQCMQTGWSFDFLQIFYKYFHKVDTNIYWINIYWISRGFLCLPLVGFKVCSDRRLEVFPPCYSREFDCQTVFAVCVYLRHVPPVQTLGV